MANKSSLVVKGDINFFTINGVFLALTSSIAQKTGDIIVDFSEVTQSNSAGLALIIALLRVSKNMQKNIRFKNLPEKLITAAKISDIDKFICYER